ncbi:MAG TPA: hypothetical protein P5254_10990 [Aquihabitans sp.]|nr:hypothetical protein [Aquihabitans sp.]
MAQPIPPSDAVLRIDCDECALQATPACEDCMVTFLVRNEVATSVVVDLAEARAVRLLAEGGLAPPLRHVRSTG